MAKLTPELLLNAPQCLNPIGHRMLYLRELQVTIIENLAVIESMFDGIDLSFNLITHLGEFPLIPSLRVLLVADNSVETISSFLSASNLPLLESINLYHNNISSLAELGKLASLPKLKELYVGRNPVCNIENFRVKLLTLLPQLTVINGSMVTAKEREQASILGKAENEVAKPLPAPVKRKMAPVVTEKKPARAEMLNMALADDFF
ncbi:Leucine-rich repeat [Carpediemonas membranifera]|uniref:Leucine-rich repeat n=1 Tax=Carpediemonas membranifera TaxID=201153 RepID=A0A8J6BYD6_9EUKA|nr:Leucine-rich repeat [Carpediemonas membranifera]|eukprot:KAG9394371.1 Leucine-rich repeat [Carpediemonas membranifera]